MNSSHIVKSFICMGEIINLLYVKSKNCYAVEHNGEILKVFSRQSNMQVMENYAMQLLTKLTDNKIQNKEKTEEK